MGLELRAILGDAAPLGEAEDLIPAAVGEDRPLPPDEPVQPAGARDEIVTGPQIEMVGVAKDDFGAKTGAKSSRSRCVTLLTAPWVPTGMKAGVCTTPCGVRISPHRAAPSRAST